MAESKYIHMGTCTTHPQKKIYHVTRYDCDDVDRSSYEHGDGTPLGKDCEWMTNQPKIDPDAAMERSRSRVGYDVPGSVDDHQTRHHLALVEAARGLAASMERVTKNTAECNVNQDRCCGLCFGEGPDVSAIRHQESCPLYGAAQALLTLEALLPAENADDEP